MANLRSWKNQYANPLDWFDLRCRSGHPFPRTRASEAGLEGLSDAEVLEMLVSHDTSMVPVHFAARYTRWRGMSSARCSPWIPTFAKPMPR
jgi:hypothetical protein